MKVEFLSEAIKISVLTKKAKLKEDDKTANVWLRSSMSHVERALRDNMRMLVETCELDLFVAGNGRLIRPNAWRGRGRGGGGRGGMNRGGGAGPRRKPYADILAE